MICRKRRRRGKLVAKPRARMLVPSLIREKYVGGSIVNVLFTMEARVGSIHQLKS